MSSVDRFIAPIGLREKVTMVTEEVSIRQELLHALAYHPMRMPNATRKLSAFCAVKLTATNKRRLEVANKIQKPRSNFFERSRRLLDVVAFCIVLFFQYTSIHISIKLRIATI